jgi:hypothetical protein
VQAHQPRPWFSRVPKGLVVLLVFAAIVALGYFGRDFIKQLGPPERCWELQEVEGKLYKVNPCTGQFLLLGDAPGR